jgi:DNA-binding NarL/FixJ family response regulator
MGKTDLKAKRVVIQHPCAMTRYGLEAVLKDHDLFGGVDIILNRSRLPDCNLHLASLDIDILIMTVSVNVYDFMPGMKHMFDITEKLDSKTKIIFFAHVFHIDVVRRYMKEVKGFHKALNVASSVKDLKVSIMSAFQPHDLLYEEIPYFGGRLSSRELTVLNRFLEGGSIKEIALELNLNYKTVSHYKRAALMKLGVNSCHPLLIPNGSKNIRMHLL